MNMTNRQLAEMMASGWGEWRHEPSHSGVCYTQYLYKEDEGDDPIGVNSDGQTIYIRPWMGIAWLEPTEELYRQFYMLKQRDQLKMLIG